MSTRSSWKNVTALVVALLIAVVPSLSQPAPPAGYQQTNLVSDVPGLAAVTDPNLVNAWGMAFNSTSPIWVSDNGTGVATLYAGNGTPNSLVVTIPPPTGGAGPSAPTGQVFNGGPGFEVDPGHAAVFIFVTEDGTISGWNPAVDTTVPPATPSTHAILKVDRSAIGAIYKGVALNSTKDRLYAANFRYGTIEVFDATWKLIDSITDPTVPPGFAPFNIQSLGGKLYVTFAKQDDDREDDVAGPGNGFVDILDPATNTFTRLISGHPGNAPLDSPWGLAIAPSGFGEFGGALLVGNFGDGTIQAFDPGTGALLGQLRHAHGGPIKIDGLWALAFGIGGNNGPPTALFFTAGPKDEKHGLFGKLEAAQ
jgi:uncharacterized protein (TIGR03118 family)